MTLQSTLQLYHGQIAEWLHNQAYKQLIPLKDNTSVYFKEYDDKINNVLIQLFIQNSDNPEIWEVSISIYSNGNNESRIMDYCDTLKEAKENAVIWVMKLITRPVF